MHEHFPGSMSNPMRNTFIILCVLASLTVIVLVLFLLIKKWVNFCIFLFYLFATWRYLSRCQVFPDAVVDYADLYREEDCVRYWALMIWNVCFMNSPKRDSEIRRQADLLETRALQTRYNISIGIPTGNLWHRYPSNRLSKLTLKALQKKTEENGRWIATVS